MADAAVAAGVRRTLYRKPNGMERSRNFGRQTQSWLLDQKNQRQKSVCSIREINKKHLCSSRKSCLLD